MDASERVKKVSAIMFYLSECYELFADVGDNEMADLLLGVIDRLGMSVTDMCVEHFLKTGDIIPRFVFTEIQADDDMIITITAIARDLTLKLVDHRASTELKSVVRDLMRGKRMSVPAAPMANLDSVLGGT